MHWTLGTSTDSHHADARPGPSCFPPSHVPLFYTTAARPYPAKPHRTVPVCAHTHDSAKSTGHSTQVRSSTSLLLLRKREASAVEPVALIIALSIRDTAHRFNRAHRCFSCAREKLSCSVLDTRRRTTVESAEARNGSWCMAQTRGFGLFRLLSAPICMSCRKQQVSEVRRATSRHAAGNLWPPRPLIHIISLRPSSMFTVLAISNVELWRCSWLQLDMSTARAAAGLVSWRLWWNTKVYTSIHYVGTSIYLSLIHI